MRQYRITSADLTQSSEDDCVLSPDDPIHALKGPSQLGGLGSSAALESYALEQMPTVESSNKGQVARELSIKSGTQEWFKHWFGDKR